MEAVDILLVEDSPEEIELVMHVLVREKLAHSVEIARDGEEALQLLFGQGVGEQISSGRRRPRLILLDLKLPKVDGTEVLRQVKADDSTRFIPVVVMTSSKEERDLIETYKLGVNSYIQKPVDFECFREMVKQLGMYWLGFNQAPAPALALSE